MDRKECDLVVVAGGPAGLAAAISAAEQEASVILLEKSNTTGGAGNMGMGPLGVETSVQRDNLIGITKEEAFRKFMDYTHWRSDARLVREYIYKSADTIDWLQAMGVEFDGAYRYFPDSEATWHIVKPESGEPGPRAASTMIKIMTQRAEELGVEILYETPAKKVLKENGAVTGVLAEAKNGEELEIECGAVILATGGFGDNPEMVKTLTPFELGNTIHSFRIPGVAGDGLKMAWEAGAAKGDTNMEVAYSCPTGNPVEKVKAVHTQPNLTVNLHGERFMNEEVMQNTTYTANALFQQKSSCGFSIIDDSIKNYYYKHGIPTVSLVARVTDIDGYDEEFSDALAKNDPYLFMADSLEELAEKTGINKENLLKTVEEYNHFCETRDELFGKNHRYMMPLKGPKYYAAALYAGGYGSLGGIKINYKAEAVDTEDEPIPGLYAAGTDACSIYGDSYVFILPGNTMGFALNSGRIAGEHAVEYLMALYEEDEA